MEFDNSFDNIIEYDEGSSSDKENEASYNIKQPKTSNEQFRKIASFMKEHDEDRIDKTTYNLLWDDLAAKLNDIGPPDHTTSEWRRIWSVHKYNNKRKRSAADTDCVDGVDPEPVLGENVMHESKLDLLIDGQNTLSVQMDLIIENQVKVIANQQTIIDELKTSNSFLEQIARKS